MLNMLYVNFSVESFKFVPKMDSFLMFSLFRWPLKSNMYFVSLIVGGGGGGEIPSYSSLLIKFRVADNIQPCHFSEAENQR